MDHGRTIFAQLMDLRPLAEFRRCVERYRGDDKVQSFSCLDQFLCLAFAQLTCRESLRDIETCLRAHSSQLYHRGFRGGVSRNTLANASQQRGWRIYADFARRLIAQARALYQHDPLAVERDPTVYVFDPTTIDLCLSLFPWAQFRRRKSTVKLHTLYVLVGGHPQKTTPVGPQSLQNPASSQRHPFRENPHLLGFLAMQRPHPATRPFYPIGSVQFMMGQHWFEIAKLARPAVRPPRLFEAVEGVELP